jgi:hypothetical protein
LRVRRCIATLSGGRGLREPRAAALRRACDEGLERASPCGGCGRDACARTVAD